MLALVGACLLALSGCTTPTEVDSEGRWMGGEEVMTAWADAQVPDTWDRVDQSVKYVDIIDDLGKDTQRDRTSFAAKYRGVTQDEFDLFAVWTSFPDGSTTTELYLTNDPV